MRVRFWPGEARYALECDLIENFEYSLSPSGDYILVIKEDPSPEKKGFCPDQSPIETALWKVGERGIVQQFDISHLNLHRPRWLSGPPDRIFGRTKDKRLYIAEIDRGNPGKPRLSDVTPSNIPAALWNFEISNACRIQHCSHGTNGFGFEHEIIPLLSEAISPPEPAPR